MIKRYLKVIFICTFFLLLSQILVNAEQDSIVFNLDDFQFVYDNEIYYSDNEINDTKIVTLQDNINTINYNGGYIDFDYINDYNYNMYHKNGTMELLDSDLDGKYETINIISPEVFVVTANSSNNSQIELKNSISNIILNYEKIINMDEEKLFNLKQNDVLEVIKNEFDPDSNCSIKKLTDNIDVTITSTHSSDNSWFPSTSKARAFGFNYISNVPYDVSYEAYGFENMKIGYSGKVYFDSYGKIAAFFWDGYNSNSRCGVIIDYQIHDSNNGNPFAEVTIIDKNETNNYRLDNNIIIEYPDSDITSFNSLDISSVKDKLIGNLIEFDDEDGYIKSIEFPKYTDEKMRLKKLNDEGETYTYNADTRTFTGENKSFPVNNTTEIYYIYKNPDGNSYSIDEEWSGVGKYDSLKSGTYYNPLFYITHKGTYTGTAITIFDNNQYDCVRFFNSKNQERTDSVFYYSQDEPINIKLNPKYYEKKVMIAGYKDNLMISLNDTLNSQTQTIFNLKINETICDYIKVFVWEDFESIIPIDVQILTRKRPLNIDYTKKPVILSSAYRTLSMDYDLETWRIEYYENALRSDYLSPDVQFYGFRTDGEEGLEDGKYLSDYIGCGLILQSINEQIVQVNMLFELTPGLEENNYIPIIRIGSNINKTTKINDDLTLYVAPITGVQNSTIFLGGYNNKDQFIEKFKSIDIPLNSSIFYISSSFNYIHKINYKNLYYIDNYGNYVIIREYKGEVTDVFAFEANFYW